MKQIISYNSEYDDMCAVTAVTEEEAPAAFRAYVKERAVELLEITENEAEDLLGINGDIEEGLVYNEETCSALFLLPTGVSEVLRVIDIPETDTEKGQDAPEIARVLTLSTAHLRKETAEMMDSDCREELSMLSIYPKIALPLQVIGESSPEEIERESFGWWVYILQDGTSEDTDGLESLPEDLSACVRYAKDRGCSLLCFDGNGDTVSSLPVYEW